MVELFVREWGVGPPIVFLHGLGASSRYWGTLRNNLEPDYRGIAPDLLGFGRSPKPADSAYDIDEHLDALLPVLPPHATVVAHSAGGVIAAALAARHPKLVTALVLIGLPAFPDTTTALREVGRLGAMARCTVEDDWRGRAACELMCRLRPLAVAFAPLLVRDLPAKIAADGPRHTWASYSRTLRRVVIEHRVAPDLSAVRMPVTLIHGRGDEVAPLAHLLALADENPHLRVHLVDGDHHVAVRA